MKKVRKKKIKKKLISEEVIEMNLKSKKSKKVP